MMNQPQTSRLAAIGLCISFLSFLWMMLVSLMFTPHHKSVKLTLPAPAPIVLARAPHVRRVALLPKKLPNPNTVALHSLTQDYTYVFTGFVTCGDNPCRQAAVQVQIQTDQNPGIVKQASIEPDGSYMVVLNFKEVPHEQIDWRIMADSKDSEAKEVHGHQILEEDPNVLVEKPIRLL